MGLVAIFLVGQVTTPLAGGKVAVSRRKGHPSRAAP